MHGTNQAGRAASRGDQPDRPDRPDQPDRSARPDQPDRSARARQRLVTERFEARAGQWDRLYRSEDLFSVIHRDRHDRALRWIDQLSLPAGSPVLEIGPGAGLMTAALERRGFRVAAADRAHRMIEIARERAAGAGLILADAHRLPFRPGSFSLVVALGVVPWLHSPQVAVAEMARVLRPGGYLVANADNRKRLSLLLDPWHSRALDRPRAAAKRLLAPARARKAPCALVAAHSLAEFDDLLLRAGLLPARSSTFGFGPFTLLRLPVLPDRLGVALNARLQRLADDGTPGLLRGGNHYLVLARRPG